MSPGRGVYVVEGERQEQIKLGDLVLLRSDAAGYPMMTNPEDKLGLGLVISYGSEEFSNSRTDMVQVLWTRSNTKRWEFIEDLIIVEHT